jgi:hypothetical protein
MDELNSNAGSVIVISNVSVQFIPSETAKLYVPAQN